MPNEFIDPAREAAKQSFTASRLTQSQFDESWAVVEIVERDIRKTGSFREKLTDYAHAFARGERFDAMKGETILRDQFKARYGQSMNAMREQLMEREKTLQSAPQDHALYHARLLVGQITGGSSPFYKAYDDAAVSMARQHGITESGAKVMMKEAYKVAEDQDLYTVGKELEKRHYQPSAENPQADRKADAPVKSRMMEMKR